MGATPSKDGVSEDAHKNSNKGSANYVEKNLSKTNSNNSDGGESKNGSTKKEDILGPQPEDLTVEEKAMIRESWSDVENSVAKVGVVMFIK